MPGFQWKYTTPLSKPIIHHGDDEANGDNNCEDSNDEDDMMTARVSNGNKRPHYRGPLIQPSVETRVALAKAGEEGKKGERREFLRRKRERCEANANPKLQ